MSESDFRLDTSSWQSLEIAFGGFRLIPEYARSVKNNEIGKEEYHTRMKALTHELTTLREKIKSELEKHPEAIQVEDLIDPELSHDFYAVSENEIDTAFAPLIVVLHMPSRLQSGFESSVARAERFILVLNGSIVMYAADASSPKVEIDFPALRDRIADIVQPVVEPEIVAPNRSKSVFLLNGPQTQAAEASETALHLAVKTTVKDGMRAFYEAVVTCALFLRNTQRCRCIGNYCQQCH